MERRDATFKVGPSAPVTLCLLQVISCVGFYLTHVKGVNDTTYYCDMMLYIYICKYTYILHSMIIVCAFICKDTVAFQPIDPFSISFKKNKPWPLHRSLPRQAHLYRVLVVLSATSDPHQVVAS